jgi:zinc protease
MKSLPPAKIRPSQSQARHAAASRWLVCLTVLLGLLVWRPVWADTPDKPLWPHLASDIAPDPGVIFGALPNGMRYALKPNQLPPGAISMRFAVEFGSIYETSEEAGLAHFIEHMAFNGSTHVPEGEMVRMLERLGLAFGADTNASTGLRETIYKLELPNASDALVGESLFLLRETASELTFDQGAIDRERGVVLAEHRRGDTFARRRSQQLIDFLLPGAPAASRLPIGNAETISAATREQMVSLYNRYYRPERAVLVISGDFDPGKMRQLVVERFSSWTGKGPAGVEPADDWSPSARQPAASVYVHPDGGDAISVYGLKPMDRPADTVAQRRSSNLLSFAVGAINRRLATLADSEAPPFRRASVAFDDVLDTAKTVALSASIRPGAWPAALDSLEQEMRRAVQYGFTQDEIDVQVANMRVSVENAARREQTRQTSALADGLLNSILDDSVFATPASGLERFNAWAGDASPALVLEQLRQNMNETGPLVFLSSTVKADEAVTDMPVAWKRSQEIAVASPASRTFAPFGYTDFGQPGRVRSDARRDDVGARLIQFENGVRLNLKRTDFQRNTAMVSVRVGAGPLDFPDEPFGLDVLMGAFSNGGLGKHSADDLRGVLAGHTVQAGFTSSSTAFGATYRTTPADLLLQLQVAAAFVTDPGYRPEAERRWREAIELSWPRLAANPQAVLRNTAMRTMMGGDRRFGTDPADGVTQRTFNDLRAALLPVLQSGAVEIAIVGDIEEGAAVDAVARTFGALPQRAEQAGRQREARAAVFASPTQPLTLTHHGEAAQALAAVYWPVPDVDPQVQRDEARVLDLLGDVMRLKVTEELRERLGAAYSPSAGAAISYTIPGWGYVSASSEVKSGMVDEAIAAMRTIAANLREGRISEDEFLRARTPLLEALPQNATSNSYWLSLISRAQSRPELVDEGKLDVVEMRLKAMTVEDLAAAARKYLRDDEARVIRIVPETIPTP